MQKLSLSQRAAIFAIIHGTAVVEAAALTEVKVREFLATRVRPLLCRSPALPTQPEPVLASAEQKPVEPSVDAVRPHLARAGAFEPGDPYLRDLFPDER